MLMHAYSYPDHVRYTTGKVGEIHNATLQDDPDIEQTSQ